MITPEGEPSAPRAFARFALQTLLAVAILGALLLRLARVERPRFETEHSFADGRLRVGRVVLARRGARGRVVGASITCGGREVLARTGARPIEVVAFDPTSQTLTLRETATRATMTVAGADCTVRNATP